MIWNTGTKSSLVTPSQIRRYTLPSPRKNPKIHAILMGIGLKDDCDSEGIGRMILPAECPRVGE